ncbi:MAG: 3-phosphoglycerate dehydrogenase [Gammaproteobacteria bacterium]|nr:3-phosphoglycerate dehydrogenase [Gammaproteobacteria bacterium]MEE3143327.1 phosphoglycerate dehydrogenase [Pseudomonadota bacterium]HBY00425.1 3-phosphoglycerate dehydrogenase [Gammaproteobacteria bacterium]|tara:strand:- start:1766 stop:2947 length:1182 start_codon:yes stop_codon:yes gene_type:complete
MHRIQTFNVISEKGLNRFPSDLYEVGADVSDASAILLRSHKLDPSALKSQLKAVARAGAGVNNIPVNDCTEQGVVVFNTPGANANAVKELVLCGLLLASREIIPSIGFASAQTNIGDYNELSSLMEKEKSRFKGHEIAGKTLGVIGLGSIGSMVAEMAINLDMKVQGYDPALSVEAAWRLPSQVKRIENLNSLVANSDFITLHIPALDSTRNLIDASMFASMREGTCLLNFARDEIVDTEALEDALDSGKLVKYVSDFPRPQFVGRKDVISMPHIGASTREAEENCAVMAANQLRDFLENGNIKNSVNFPSLSLDREVEANKYTRLTISNKNVPKMLGQILSVLADQNINVIDMLNKSRGEIAYNLIDLESPPSEEVVAAIIKIKNVIKVTVI